MIIIIIIIKKIEGKGGNWIPNNTYKEEEKERKWLSSEGASGEISWENAKVPLKKKKKKQQNGFGRAAMNDRSIPFFFSDFFLVDPSLFSLQLHSSLSPSTQN